jgi:DNA-binding NtrC family response regulator
VVIVDDDRDYTRMLTQLLGLHLDCTVVTFSRPRAALAALPRLNAGVIVTDYEMPEMHGFDFMAEAAKLVPGVPFILITGHPVDALAPQIIASPVKSVLAKPFSSQKLFEEIERLWPEGSGALPRAHTTSAYLQSGVVA